MVAFFKDQESGQLFLIMNRWSYKSVYLMSHIGERNRSSRDHRHTVFLYCFFIWFPVTFSAYLFPHHLPVSHGGILKCYCKPLCRRSPPRLLSEAVEVIPVLLSDGTQRSLCFQPSCFPLFFILGTLSPTILWKKGIISTDRNAHTCRHTYI